MLISNYAIKFRIAVYVITAGLILTGIWSYVTLPRESSPDITIPYVFVTAVYEGTAPEEVEKLITIPMEKKIKDVEGIKKFTTYSSDSVATLVVEFEAGRDIDKALQHVKDKIDLAKPDLPGDLDEPTVQSLNFSSDIPVFTFTLSGATSPERLKKLAEELQDSIELIPGVRMAEISGTQTREIRVELDLPRMISYGIPLALVVQRISEENKTISAGHFEVAGNKFQVRIPGEYKLAANLKNLPIYAVDDRVIYLSDIASVSDTFKDVETIARINTDPCVTIGVKKREGINAVELIDRVKSDVIAPFVLPPDVTITEVVDQSVDVSDMISELENNIASGFILVVLVLVIFMGVRNSLFVGLAIPLSMLISFAVLNFMGVTLNMVVLFALVLAVGMLVDNAIVIVENIYRHRTLGLSKKEAAREGASEVAWPVITSTLTTLAAFSPLLFWPGIMGQFMSFMPMTLIVVLVASLFVALVVNPAICSALISARPKDHGDGDKDHFFVHWYEKILRGALNHRLLILLLGFSFLVFSVVYYARYGRGVELFPSVDPRSADISVSFPQGMSVERTDAALKEFEHRVAPFADVKFFTTTVGASGGDISGGKGTHLGNIHVEFVKHDRRSQSSQLTVDQMRDAIGKLPGAEVVVEKSEEGPPRQEPIRIEISGDKFDQLSELTRLVKEQMAQVSGVVDIKDDLDDSLPEVQFIVDRERAVQYGVDTATIGMFLRAALYGLEASTFRVGEDEYDITVRFPKEQRDSVSLLDQIFIPVQNGTSVPLSSLGTVKYAGARGTISRKNYKRTISITANNQGRGVDEIIAEIMPLIDALPFPRGYSVYYAGDTEDMQENGAFLGRAFIMAIGLILVILVIQFNSILIPAIIGFSVLLSLIGVMWGLIIGQMKFCIVMTGVGVISLAGIVVNNAIVLIDCIIQRRAEGLHVDNAIIDAGRTRLRPVLLTATTTVLGLIPMAIGWSVDFHEWPPRLVSGAESSSWWAPMAYAVMFGLVVSTILTLILVPVMYSVMNSISQRFARLFNIKDD